MILVGNTILQGPEGAAVHQVVADMSHKLKSSKKIEKGWKVLNVLHRVCKTPRIMPHTTFCTLDFANLELSLPSSFKKFTKHECHVCSEFYLCLKFPVLTGQF